MLPTLEETGCFVLWSTYNFKTNNQINSDLAPIIGHWKYQDTTGNTRPLFGVIDGQEQDPSHLVIYWRGVAEKYMETWNISFLNITKHDDLNNLGDGTSYGVKLNKIFSLVGDGYYGDLSDENNFKPGAQYWFASTTKSALESWNKTTLLTQAKVVPKTTTDGILYKHIISYKNNTPWMLTNEGFLNTLRNCSDAKKDSAMSGAVTKTIKGRYSTTIINKGGTIQQAWDSTYAGAFSSSAASYVNGNTNISSIGMLSDKNSNQIYQYSYKTSTPGTRTYCNKQFEIPNIKLSEGMQLCGAKKDTQNTWQIEIASITGINDPSEAEVYFSYEKFGDSLTTSDPVVLDNGENYIRTSGKKALAKWTNTKESLVYVKIVPYWSDVEEHLDDAWEIKMSLVGDSGKITQVTPDE